MWLLFALVGAVVCLGLIVLWSYVSRMGEARVIAAVERAYRDVEKGKLGRAERRLYDAMKWSGWNYEGYLAARAANTTQNIEQVAPSVVRIARIIKALPKNTFTWMPPGFLLLGEIYERQGKSTKAVKLYDDLTTFFDGYGDDVAYSDRCRFFEQIYGRQARYELAAKNGVGAMRLLAGSYFMRVGWLKATGQESLLVEIVPYVPDDAMNRALDLIGKPEARATICEIIDRQVRAIQGRINAAGLMREIDLFFAGAAARNADEAELLATRDIIHRALSRAAEMDRRRKPDGEPDEQEDRPKTIILGE